MREMRDERRYMRDEEQGEMREQIWPRELQSAISVHVAPASEVRGKITRQTRLQIATVESKRSRDGRSERQDGRRELADVRRELTDVRRESGDACRCETRFR